MADNKKFERMIELLINEDKQGAEELFHEIVVEKSRQIYENILQDEYELEEDDDLEEGEYEADEADDEDDDLMDDWDLEEDDLFDADPMGGDATDDMINDVGADDSEDEMDFGDEGDDTDEMDFGSEDDDSGMENRMDDIEDEIEDLKSQLEKLIGEKGDDMEDMGDMEDEADDEDEGEDEDEGDDMEDEADDEADDMPMPPKAKTESKKSATERMREYVEKVGGDTYDKFGKMGDNGANTKSPVAGANKMGGSAANIVAGGESSTAGTKGGLADPSTKDMNTKNVNVPGGKASKAQSKVAKGHGAEKIGDKDSAPNKKSLL